MGFLVNLENFKYIFYNKLIKHYKETSKIHISFIKLLIYQTFGLNIFIQISIFSNTQIYILQYNYDGIQKKVMLWLLSGPPGFTFWISFAPVFSFIYC